MNKLKRHTKSPWCRYGKRLEKFRLTCEVTLKQTLKTVLVSILVFLALYALTAYAKTKDENMYYSQSGDVGGLAIVATSAIVVTDLPVTSVAGREKAPAKQVAFSASVYPSEDVKRAIDQTFGLNSIMYWVALNESSLDPKICNPSGACGLFQITGGTFKSCNVEGVRTDLVPNVKCAKILYDRKGLKDWEWSRNEGFDGGWGKHLGDSIIP